jgi:hypothetical protein
VDERDRHVAIDYAKLVMAFSMLLIAIMFTVLVLWLAMAKQDSKLYESDNVVCASQPFSLQCWERKAR